MNTIQKKECNRWPLPEGLFADVIEEVSIKTGGHSNYITLRLGCGSRAALYGQYDTERLCHQLRCRNAVLAAPRTLKELEALVNTLIDSKTPVAFDRRLREGYTSDKGNRVYEDVKIAKAAQ